MRAILVLLVLAACATATPPPLIAHGPGYAPPYPTFDGFAGVSGDLDQ